MPLGCWAQEQEPKCEGPLTEAKTLRLAEEGVTERRTIALLVACGMAFEVTEGNQARLKELGFSEEALGAIKWLEKWELLGTVLDAASIGRPRLSLAGAWTATFSDSKMNGTLFFNIAQTDDGTVRGTYSSSLGGGGTVFGTVWDKEGKLEVRQNIEGCPGVTKAILRKAGDSLTGDYTGFDCAGPHLNGKFTLSPGVSLVSTDETAPTVVQGSVLELRMVRTIHVVVMPEHTTQKRTIESVLRDKRIPLVEDPVKADLFLEYSIFQEKPFLGAVRLIQLHNTMRILWVCPADAERPEDSRVAEFCANKFAEAYAETHPDR